MFNYNKNCDAVLRFIQAAIDFLFAIQPFQASQRIAEQRESENTNTNIRVFFLIKPYICAFI